MKLSRGPIASVSLVLATMLGGCDSNSGSSPAPVVTPDPFTFPANGTSLPFSLISQVTNLAFQVVDVRNGGFGSAMVPHPTLPGHFYALTDRGPNAAITATPPGIVFVAPTYTPRIGLYRLTPAGTAEQVEEILLRAPDGRRISGLPNFANGNTGETPYGLYGSAITLDPDGDGNIGFDESGFDGEGLVALRDGTFWASDEYGPHMVHYDAEGIEIERINAFAADSRNAAGRRLAPEFSRRWPNRGMEGLAITPDESTLVGIMQSSLDNPTQAAARNSDLTRIVTINRSTGARQQFLYRQEANGHSNSEIATLTASTYLVVERDQKFFGRDGNTGSGTGAGNVFKRLYRIDLTGATDVDTGNTALIASSPDLSDGGDLGLLIDGITLEQYIRENRAAGWERLASLGIVPVAKSLAFDAVTELAYPHDKLEGIWVIDANTVGIINDDDFALEPDGQGGVMQKVLGDGNVDGNRLFVVRLPTPLY